jgi:hypothetical protein
MRVAETFEHGRASGRDLRQLRVRQFPDLSGYFEVECHSINCGRLCAGAVGMSTKIGGRWFRVHIPLLQ